MLGTRLSQQAARTRTLDRLFPRCLFNYSTPGNLPAKRRNFRRLITARLSVPIASETSTASTSLRFYYSKIPFSLEIEDRLSDIHRYRNRVLIEGYDAKDGAREGGTGEP